MIRDFIESVGLGFLMVMCFVFGLIIAVYITGGSDLLNLILDLLI